MIRFQCKADSKNPSVVRLDSSHENPCWDADLRSLRVGSRGETTIHEKLSISRLHSYILPKAAEFQNFASDTLSILA